MLNTDQQHAFELFQTGKSIFITGPGGCGKSYLIEHIRAFCDQKLISVVVTALTGCAASLISGQTLHGWSGIGLGKESAPDIIRYLQRRPQHFRRWKAAQILIIDEISMMSLELFNKLHLIAQGIRRNELFFGGIQLVLCGDFAQLEPIGSEKLCFESKLWQEHIDHNTVYISEIIRQNDPVFQGILLRLRLGELTDQDKKVLNGRLMVDESDANVAVTDEEQHEIGTIKATVLYPLKKDVNRVNDSELQKLLESGPESRTYKSLDSVTGRKSNQEQQLRAAHVEQLNKCTNAPETLVLAIGAQVMLTKNKSLDEGLVNGSRGVVIDINEVGSPIVMFDNGQQVTITPEVFVIESGESVISRRQIPLILAWALTIHKCQGATLTSVITDLSEVFGNAQAYVTLSRVRSLEGLFIVSINYSKIRCNPKVKKYYKDLENQKAPH
jgi:ATP-dependent DNA helicase PIF1